MSVAFYGGLNYVSIKISGPVYTSLTLYKTKINLIRIKLFSKSMVVFIGIMYSV